MQKNPLGLNLHPGKCSLTVIILSTQQTHTIQFHFRPELSRSTFLSSQSILLSRNIRSAHTMRQHREVCSTCTTLRMTIPTCTFPFKPHQACGSVKCCAANHIWEGAKFLSNSPCSTDRNVYFSAALCVCVCVCVCDECDRT